MSTWTIGTSPSGRVLVHHNPLNGRTHRCGLVEGLPEKQIVEWVFDQARPLDLLLFDDGRVFCIALKQGRA